MAEHANTEGYAGDVSVTHAWSLLKDNPASVLIDVRTQAEWAFVGVPDLTECSKAVHYVEWQRLPSMARNDNFADELSASLKQHDVSADAPLLFLCRSGVRSRAAAIEATRVGYAQCFNVAGGFEGDLNEERRRSSVNGWRYAGLPWSQS